jgi:hypothetical protein
MSNFVSHGYALRAWEGRYPKVWVRDVDVVGVVLADGGACVHNVNEVEFEKEIAKIVI